MGGTRTQRRAGCRESRDVAEKLNQGATTAPCAERCAATPQGRRAWLKVKATVMVGGSKLLYRRLGGSGSPWHCMGTGSLNGMLPMLPLFSLFWGILYFRKSVEIQKKKKEKKEYTH